MRTLVSLIASLNQVRPCGADSCGTPHGEAMVVVPTRSANARSSRDDPQLSQLRLIYSFLPASQAVALGTGVMLVVGLSSVIDTDARVGWFTALVLVSLGRTYLGVLFRRASSSANGASIWRTYFTIGAVASGLVWGSTGLFLYAPESILHQVFLAFVLGGMVIGAVAALTPLFLAFVFF